MVIAVILMIIYECCDIESLNCNLLRDDRL